MSDTTRAGTSNPLEWTSSGAGSVTGTQFWKFSTTVSLLVGYVGYYLCRNNLSAAFPLLGQELSLNNAQLGQIAFWSELAYAGGKFVTGPIGDRFGGKRLFLLGMAGTIACNLAFAQASTLSAFVLIWCVCRFFLSMGWNGMVPVISRWFEPSQYGRVMGFLSLSFQFGGVVATLFAGMLLAQGKTWHELFTYPAFVLTILLVACAFFVREAPRAVDVHGKPVMEATQRRGFLSLLASPLFRYLLAFSFFATFLRSVFLTWVPKILVDLGQQNVKAVLLSTLFPALGALSTIGIGFLTDRRLERRQPRGLMLPVMLGGLTVSLFGCAYVVGVRTDLIPWLAWLIGACGFFLLGPYSMSAGSLSLDVGGEKDAGSCAGFVDGVGYVGGVLALWMAGLGADRWGWGAVFLMLAVFGVVAMGSAHLLTRALDRRDRETGAL